MVPEITCKILTPKTSPPRWEGLGEEGDLANHLQSAKKLGQDLLTYGIVILIAA